jgi:hypothetical protein
MTHGPDLLLCPVYRIGEAMLCLQGLGLSQRAGKLQRCEAPLNSSPATLKQV